ncbi:uncharacterized protein LOC113335967 [Papaver somniferum]|uniref:uncharacterized protein LOC113335967 n=1 Tax=Papaver somniferum TaxID=3469 RepID=UPI000E705684|nr:uncharacterized protein LOC113335967 [Papaver somniferum]XP_026437753.1 uncharacterized protein LOC113335967 [Papaver somniferum]
MEGKNRCKLRLVHATNKGLKLTEILPLLPDIDREKRLTWRICLLMRAKDNRKNKKDLQVHLMMTMKDMMLLMKKLTKMTMLSLLHRISCQQVHLGAVVLSFIDHPLTRRIKSFVLWIL